MMPRIVSPTGKIREVTDKQADGFLMAARGWRLFDDLRPAVNDPKDMWVDYAESLGVDTDGLSKRDVIDAVGD